MRLVKIGYRYGQSFMFRWCKLFGLLHRSATHTRGWFSHSILALTSIDSINYRMPIPSGSLSLIFRRDASCGKMFLSLCSFCALSSAWGGIILRQSRQALELEMIGLTFFSDSQHFLVDENNTCYDVPQDDLSVGCGNHVFSNHLLGISPVCVFDPTKADSGVFNVLYLYSLWYAKSFDGTELETTGSLVVHYVHLLSTAWLRTVRGVGISCDVCFGLVSGLFISVIRR
jgi:hypothetical protein